MFYGYGGIGKVFVDNKFFDYGELYFINDIICCCINFDFNLRVVFFIKNGKYFGVVFCFGVEVSGKVFFFYIIVKNMCFMVNFG